MPETNLSDQAIFEVARQIGTPDAREVYLSQVCAGDNPKYDRVAMLLQAYDKQDSFLESPPPGIELTEIRPLTEQPGDTIGPYKLLQQIGEGGMGVVYMAEQTEPVERRVALKIIKPGMDTQQVIARFEAERQALAMMDHPNIAKVLDAGTTETGRPYFVMELVKGMPVTQYCDEQHLTPRERLELFLPICQAVQHAHQKGIIHRDLKPSNILIAQYDNKAVPKIIDFGVAKATSHKLTEKTMFTQYGQIVGTLEYMSPEQARFNQLDVDTRSDIYSLGVLLYELLTGETPFDKKRLRSVAFDELLRIIREEEPPKPSTKLSSSEALASTAVNRKMEPRKLSLLVRGDLDWIVMKALEKDRNRRYGTASAFAADVEHYLQDQPVLACPPSAAYKFRKFARRNKALIGTIAAVAASLIVGIIGTTWQAYRATKAEGKAIAEAERADREAENAKTEAAVAKAVNDFLNDDLLGMADAKSQFEADLTPDPNIMLRTLLDRAAETIEGKFADQPLVEAAIQHTIGRAYLAIGAYQKAEKHIERAVELRQQELGGEHETTLESLFNLAEAYRKQDRYAEAEKLYKQRLEIRRRVLGVEHPDTLSSMTSLALVYGEQGRYAEAEKLHQQTLEILQRTLGNEHQFTRTSMANLAVVYHNTSRYAEAEKLYQQLLEIQRRVLGDEHPGTLRSMSSLSMVYLAQKRYAEGQQLCQQTLEILQRTLGDGHPDTLDSMHTLAIAYEKQGRYTEAEQLHQQTLEIQRRILGDENSETLKTMSNLALVYCDQGRYAEAEQLYQQSLEIERRILGDEHPSTLVSMSGLARAYWGQERYADAEKLFQQTFEICRRVRGEEHPHTLYNMRSLAVVYSMQGRYAEAIACYKQAIELDPNDVMAYLNRAGNYAALGQWAEAAADFQRTREIDPKNDEAWRFAAYAYLAGGDDASYRRTCHELVERFGQTDDPVMAERTAKVCSLAPAAVADFGVVERLAQVAVTGTEQHAYYHFFILAKGLAEDRAGRHEEAVNWLERFEPNAGRGLHFDAVAFAALAMAQHRLGRADEAKDSLAKAKAILAEKMPDLSKGRMFEANWHDWLHAQMLSREAEEMLENDTELLQHDLKKSN